MRLRTLAAAVGGALFFLVSGFANAAESPDVNVTVVFTGHHADYMGNVPLYRIDPKPTRLNGGTTTVYKIEGVGEANAFTMTHWLYRGAQTSTYRVCTLKVIRNFVPVLSWKATVIGSGCSVTPTSGYGTETFNLTLRMLA